MASESGAFEAVVIFVSSEMAESAGAREPSSSVPEFVRDDNTLQQGQIDTFTVKAAIRELFCRGPLALAVTPRL